MKTIKKMTFESNINRDNGYTNHSEGTHSFTMELFSFKNGHFQIEWDIPSMDETEHIGIDLQGTELVGYDGVFELPVHAVVLLEQCGYDCKEYIKEDWSASQLSQYNEIIASLASPIVMLSVDNNQPITLEEFLTINSTEAEANQIEPITPEQVVAVKSLKVGETYTFGMNTEVKRIS